MKLIDRTELLNKLDKILDYVQNHLEVTNPYNSLLQVGDAILDCKLIEAETIKHGKWILEREPDGKPYCYHCSVCDPDFHYIGIAVAYDYCPLCGAIMDLESEQAET